MIAKLSALQSNRRFRYVVIAALDALAAALSLVAALALRMSGDVPRAMAEGLFAGLPLVTLASVVAFHATGLYGRVWRYVSFQDLGHVVMAATLAIALSVAGLAVADRVDWMPMSVPIIQWFVLVLALGGIRIVRRAAAEASKGRAARIAHAAKGASEGPVTARRALVYGTAEQVEPLLRLLAASGRTDYVPVGILDDSLDHRNKRLRGVPILGPADAIEHVVQQLDGEGRRPDCLIMADCAAPAAGGATVNLVLTAERLGLTVWRLPDPGALQRARQGPLDLEGLNMADLLGRPQKLLDIAAVARSIAGRRVLVTGAGGTIGRELVRQIAALDPAELVLLDAGEFNLYSADQEMAESWPDLPRKAVLCSIRQREHVFAAFAAHRPELVFHAAALKHVPLVEENPCAGVQTNVLGTRNVADAAKRFGVRAMVQVSTDKAVNPVGMMGQTKRLGELYAQALDLDGSCRDGAPRFLTVRFGNVLGSSGSLIPLFQRQLSRGVPLTVTHPDITRYFMTVNEAVSLILQSTAQALEGKVRRGRIFVLDMGEPIKIVDVARRMIRLAGLSADHDANISIVGLRPGEKLFEELFDATEQRLPSAVPGIFEAEPGVVPRALLDHMFDRLATACSRGDAVLVRRLVADVLARSVAGAVPDDIAHAALPEPPRAAGVAMYVAAGGWR